MLLSKLLGPGRKEELALRIDGRPPTDPALAGWLGLGRASTAGVDVTEHNALSLSAVFAGVNLLSRVTGSLPLSVYRRSGKAKLPAESHPAYRLLATRPNPEMTASVFRRVLDWSRLLCGKACAEIQWDGGGNPRALWPLEGYRVQERRDDAGKLFFLVDGQRKVAPADMLYVPLVSADGVSGRSFLEYAVESLGLSISAQQFAAAFFGNGARPGGLLKHTGTPPPEKRKEMREGWTREHGGSPNAHRVAVLWGGWEFVRDAGAIAPDEAQLLETRKFSAEEVSRWLNVPPHLLAELSRATFGNIEEQGINFIAYSLGPTLVDYEQEYDAKLLDPPRLYCRHGLRALTRGNMQARGSFYREMFNIGAFSINDILEEEDENPIPGGDTHFVPLNMIPLEQAIKEPPPEPKPAPAVPGAKPGPGQEGGDGQGGGGQGAGGPGADAYQQQRKKRALLTQVYGRLLRLEMNAVRRAAKKPAEFLAWIDETYPADPSRIGWVEEQLREGLAPALAACVGDIDRGEELAAKLARREAEASRAQLLELAGEATAATLAEVVERCLAEDWKPEAFADSVLGELQ
jgi:HK97 family phage portal protein